MDTGARTTLESGGDTPLNSYPNPYPKNGVIKYIEAPRSTNSLPVTDLWSNNTAQVMMDLV